MATCRLPQMRRRMIRDLKPPRIIYHPQLTRLIWWTMKPLSMPKPRIYRELGWRSSPRHLHTRSADGLLLDLLHPTRRRLQPQKGRKARENRQFGDHMTRDLTLEVMIMIMTRFVVDYCHFNSFVYNFPFSLPHPLYLYLLSLFFFTYRWAMRDSTRPH